MLQNFIKINIISPNYVDWKMIQLTLRYEYSTTRILHKAQVIYALETAV